MAASYHSPIAVIHEMSEDEKKGELKSDEGSAAERTHRHSRSSHGATMPMTKANISKERERERERSKRYHRSTPSGSTASRHTHTSSRKTKNTSAKRTSGVRERESDDHEGRSRHRRSNSHRSRDISSSSSSSSEEETAPHNHRIVLSSARARLTSPSTISNLTSLTNTTNKSSSSSGSNSTVTQASITKRTVVEKKPDIPEGPMSPAVPDAPNVFAYLDPDGSVAGSKVDLGSTSFDTPSKWEIGRVESAIPTPMLQVAGSSSSASSSFHGSSSASDAPHDIDTDRSTSPERSLHGEEFVEFEEEEEEEEEEDAPEMETVQDDTEAKIASQMAAAQQRQNYHGQIQAYGTPDMQRGPANLPHIPGTALSSRPMQQMKQHPLPRAEKLPVTGYELLASQLSSRPTPRGSESGESSEIGGNGKIKPIYRKFEALNHRLLLHLQDELVELEEQLKRLDCTDTQSRRTDTGIVPASRRASAAAGGELQWHKTDVLGKIGWKLGQYSKFPVSSLASGKWRESERGDERLRE